MNIRRARPDEAPQLAAVHVEGWRTSYRGLLPQSVIQQADLATRTEQWRQWLDVPDDGLFVYVAENGRGIDGFVACGPRRSSGNFDGEVLAIYLRAAAKRQGLGRRLMHTAAMRLRNSGARSMGLTVLASNPARGFYEALQGRCSGEQESEVRGHPCVVAGYVWDNIETLCGGELHWCGWGDGAPAVVLVHGWTGDGDLWQLQVDALRDKCRVIILDLPGHGASRPAGADYSIDLFAKAVVEVMDKAGVTQAILVGHSMGGVIVRHLAKQWPDRVQGLALIDTPFALGTSSYFDDKARAFAGPDGHAQRLRTIQRMFSAQAFDVAKQRVLAGVMATPDAEAAKMFRTMTNPHIAAEPPLPLPVLAIPASGITMGDEQFLRQMFPLSQFRRIECGHFVTMEQPEQLNALLLDFAGQFSAGK